MRILPRAWSYDYFGWYPGPWPLFKKLEAEQRWYQSMGFSGILPEYLDRNMGTDVHMWLSWKLAWDKTARVDDLLAMFYPRYYGPAAQKMRGIYEGFERQMLGAGGNGEATDVARLYPLKLVNASLAAVAQAKRLAAPDATTVARIQRDENCLKLLRLFLDTDSYAGKYRRSGSAADKSRTVAAGEAYLRLADSLKGTLTVGGQVALSFSRALDATKDPGTVFAKAGPFTYQDSLNDGGKVFQAKRRSGFTIGVYGLYLKANTAGEVVYDMRAGEGLKFKDARLYRMYMFLPEGGHNSVEISRDGGQTWTVAYRDVRMADGNAQYDVTQYIAGAGRFLLKLRAQAGRKDGLVIDNWGIAGDVE